MFFKINVLKEYREWFINRRVVVDIYYLKCFEYVKNRGYCYLYFVGEIFIFLKYELFSF